MAHMTHDEYSETYNIKQLEYLVRKKGKLEIKRHVPQSDDKRRVPKSDVIALALSLNLDQAAVDQFFAQPDIQDDIRDKAWYSRRVVASNIPTITSNPTTTTTANPTIVNNPTTTNSPTTTSNPTTSNNPATASNPTTSNNPAIAITPSSSNNNTTTGNVVNEEEEPSSLPKPMPLATC